MLSPYECQKSQFPVSPEGGARERHGDRVGERRGRATLIAASSPHGRCVCVCVRRTDAILEEEPDDRVAHARNREADDASDHVDIEEREVRDDRDHLIEHLQESLAVSGRTICCCPPAARWRHAPTRNFTAVRFDSNHSTSLLECDGHEEERQVKAETLPYVSPVDRPDESLAEVQDEHRQEDVHEIVPLLASVEDDRVQHVEPVGLLCSRDEAEHGRDLGRQVEVGKFAAAMPNAHRWFLIGAFVERTE